MPVEPRQDTVTEVEQLRRELAVVREENRRLVGYVRAKIDQLLDVMGTSHINPDELDDHMLLEFDPVGIVCESFIHVLANLRNTNEELRFTRDEIQAVFETAGAAILVLNPRREIVAYNRKVEEFFIPDRSPAFGKCCREVICGEAYRPECCSFEQVVSGEVPEVHLEWTMDERCFDVIARPILDAAHNVTHVVISYSDMTERKRSMRALHDALLETQEAKSQVSGILLSVEDALIVSDSAGRVIMLNEAGETLLKRTDDLSQGEPGSLANLLFEHLHTDHGRQGLWVGDLTVVPTYGEPRVFQARSSLVSLQGGGAAGFVTFLHDVTREREIERLKSEFVSTAAHELRTPLSTILGFSELILNEESLSKEDLHDYIGIVHQKAEGLAMIVNDLLDISRIESGEGLHLEVSGCRLRELCDTALLGFRIYADRYAFKQNIPDQEVLLHVDRFAIAQVLENVLGNAVKYSPAGSIITLEADVIGGECHVCVCDEGIGMTSDQAQRIFDKFYRADASNTAIQGTGLGMTIVKYIVEAHGGRVWVNSMPGEGTTVHFTLPLLD